jgi:hypothetical protein
MSGEGGGALDFARTEGLPLRCGESSTVGLCGEARGHAGQRIFFFPSRRRRLVARARGGIVWYGASECTKSGDPFPLAAPAMSVDVTSGRHLDRSQS